MGLQRRIRGSDTPVQHAVRAKLAVAPASAPMFDSVPFVEKS